MKKGQRIRKSIVFGAFLLLILITLTGCYSTNVLSGGETLMNDPSSTPVDSQEIPNAPSALVPSIMIEGTLYLMSQKEKPDIKIAESGYLGTINSTVPLSEWPTVNEQANIDVGGAPYAAHGNGLVVLWNGEWTLFLTVQERLMESGEYQDAERVDLGCCVANIPVLETALLGENTVTHTNNDFIMTLNSDKHIYSTRDIIMIWGTLEYVGDNETVEIWHGCPFMGFSIAGGDAFDFGSVMRDVMLFVLVSSVLERGRVYHFDYIKSGGWSADDPNAEYWESFFSKKDLLLPVGEYTITLNGNFGLSERVSDSESGLSAELKFVVT